ncbi:MAG: hypothetical protein JWQ66_4222 [Mucilaginibacter sp.]|nr:hypothetical protein [Mucilaginibacter sp.]
MDTNEELNPATLPSRRKFFWGLSAFALLATAAAAARNPFSKVQNIFAGKPASKKKMVTMLTQDGTLVEVDELAITSCKRKINKNELLNWIKK